MSVDLHVSISSSSFILQEGESYTPLSYKFHHLQNVSSQMVYHPRFR